MDKNPFSILVLIWPLVKLLLFLSLAVLALGIVAGVFTYGRRTNKRRKSEGTLDDIMQVGMILSHRLIDVLLGKRRRISAGWLDDQQVLSMLRGMRPAEFEDYVAEIFSALGYMTEVSGGKNDGGIDIFMKKDGRQHVVQCKKFITQKVRPHDVRDFFGAMGDAHIDGKGFFVTTNIFTLEAERFAEGKPMELIDGVRLVELVRESGIIGKKTESGDEKMCPECGSALVLRTNKTNGAEFYGCSAFPKCRYTSGSNSGNRPLKKP